MAKYKVGDKVRLMTLDQVKEIATNSDSFSFHVPGNSIVKGMFKLLGTVVTIRGKGSVSLKGTIQNYYIKESTSWSWPEAIMLGLDGESYREEPRKYEVIQPKERKPTLAEIIAAQLYPEK